MTVDAAEKIETPEGGITDDLTAEINAGIEAVIEDLQVDDDSSTDDDVSTDKDDKDDEDDQDGDAPGEDDKSDDADQDGDAPGDEDSDDEKKPDPISDELLTRAVKAGMSLTKAKGFQDAEALEEVCGLLEKKDGSDDGGADDTDDAEDETDLLDSIPDLDPEEYEEEIVNGFKAMKSIIKSQQDLIAGLKQDRTGAQKSLFDEKVDSLGEAYVAVIGKGKVDPTSSQGKKREELSEMIDVLQAGYDSKGQTVSPQEVFNQALGIVLPDVLQQAALDAKDVKLQKRSKQITNRPGRGKARVKGDAFEEVAAELDNKFFKD